jgi:hypothetical protein
MTQEYSKLPSLPADEFQRRISKFDKKAATKSDAKDIAKMERLLELRPGVLGKDEFYVSNVKCTCGRQITFYDLVASSLMEGHSKSFVVHTLLGSKHFIQPPRKITCVECGTVHTLDYCNDRYGCCN